MLPESPEQRDHRLAWWREARLGLFIHWGPASVAGTEISWSRIGHPFDHHGYESVPAAEYDRLYQRFNPVKFDADAWMQLASDAGMKYVVFTTKHHDGFSMWPTQLSDYNIMASPFKRDICGELAEAAHRRGLKLGWYYSTRDWFHPDYLKDGNAKYNDFYHGQLRELLTNYGQVDLLWFDHVAGQRSDYRFQELFDLIYSLQPNILINDRAARFVFDIEEEPDTELRRLIAGDFLTPEQRIGVFQNHYPWESCVTLSHCADTGGWSYRPDSRTRSFTECRRMLADCACGDGNLLLNIGPLPTGEVAANQQAVLRQLGHWLDQHEESIRATRGGPFLNGPWGGSTFRDKTIYLHVESGQGRALRLPPLKAKILRISSPDAPAPHYEQTAQGISINLPADQSSENCLVIKLELDALASAEMIEGKPLAGTGKAD